MILRPEKHVGDPVRQLRHALKALLRWFGLRAISVSENKKVVAIHTVDDTVS